MGESRVFSFEMYVLHLNFFLEVFLYNFFRIVAFSNDPCALQKHTFEVIERICGIPATEGVTVTPLQTRLLFPFQHKVLVLEAPLTKSFSF